MKVVLLAPTPPPHGGIAGWTQRMLNANLKNGWDIVVVDEKTINRKDAYSSANSIWVELKRCIRIWRNLNNELKDIDVKIVQACIPARATSMMREYISSLITRARKRKFIVHFRCTLPNLVKSRFSLLMFKCLVKNSDCVFVLNEASACFVKKYSPSTKCYIIPNFIEKKAIHEKVSVNAELNTLVYVGGVNQEKGCGLIFDIAKQFPNKEFRLIGHVDMNIDGISDNVFLLGEQNKEYVQKELANADAFLFLSRFSGEGFSNALAEAMSYSLPCVVSDWAANSDMIENKGGVVLKNYELREAVEAIKIIENPEIRKEMGNWNYNKVRTKYCDSVVTGMYVDAYEDLMM